MGGAHGSDFASGGNERNTVDLALPPRIPASVQGGDPLLEQHRVKYTIPGRQSLPTSLHLRSGNIS